MSLVEDEHAFASSTNQIYWNVNGDLIVMLIDIAHVISNNMNFSSKSNLQALGVLDRSSITISAKHVIRKHHQSKFSNLIKKGLPSFWDGQEYFHM